jgi:hypothetical protein
MSLVEQVCRRLALYLMAALIASPANATDVVTYKCGAQLPRDDEHSVTVRTDITLASIAGELFGFEVVHHASDRKTKVSMEKQYPISRVLKQGTHFVSWSGIYVNNPRVSMIGIGQFEKKNRMLYTETIYHEGEHVRTHYSMCKQGPPIS